MITKDQKDAEILRILEQNGKISNLELAEKVHLSPSATSRRVADMERRGIIKGYRAILDGPKIGRAFTVYIAVGLSLHNKEAQEAFEQAINRAPEVRECHNVAGVFEYLLRIETSDLAAYKHFHTEVLGTLPQVDSITSYIVMESSKDERA